MQATVPIALFGWLIVVIGLFMTLKPHRAVIAAVIGGYLFLPKARWTIASGIPDWSPDCSISMYTLACALAFAPARITSFRPSRLDAIIGLGFASWGFSSIVAGFGLKQAVPDWWFYLNWAVIPYFLARCFITTPDELRDLAMGVLLGIAVYAPLMLFESRTLPQLNKWVYGWAQDKGIDFFRMGGIRPSVFMSRGLALSIWTCVGAVLATAIWLSKSVKSWYGIPISIMATGSVIMAMLTRSGGAIGLMMVGLAILVTTTFTGLRTIAIAIPLSVAIYLASGMFGSALPLREYAVAIAGVAYPERAFSLQTRFNHEAVLAAKSRERLLFGHGGWGNYRDIDAEVVKESTGRSSTVTDGFWIIVFGQRGLLGVVTTFGWMLVPAAYCVWLAGRSRAPRSLTIMIAGVALWGTLYAADLLLNGFVSPLQGFMAGSLVAMCSYINIRAKRTRHHSISLRAMARENARLRHGSYNT